MLNWDTVLKTWESQLKDEVRWSRLLASQNSQQPSCKRKGRSFTAANCERRVSFQGLFFCPPLKGIFSFSTMIRRSREHYNPLNTVFPAANAGGLFYRRLLRCLLHLSCYRAVVRPNHNNRRGPGRHLPRKLIEDPLWRA